MNGCLIVQAFVSSAAPVEVAETFIEDCERLTAAPHRLSGTDAYHDAADYVVERLEAIGGSKIVQERFRTVQTFPTRCELVVGGNEDDGETIALLPMRPNGIVPPVTDEGGITGRLIYGGHGRTGAYKDVRPRGNIVVDIGGVLDRQAVRWARVHMHRHRL